jgi:hypothetical protein
MKSFVILLLLLCSTAGLLAQDTLTYKVEADDHGFMCPFLTPMFMNKMKELGAVDVRKDDSLAIWFKAPPSAEMTSERIVKILEGVGYQRKILHVQIMD